MRTHAAALAAREEALQFSNCVVLQLGLGHELNDDDLKIPELVAAELAYDGADEAEEHAYEALLSAIPTTAEGVQVLSAHLASLQSRKPTPRPNELARVLKNIAASTAVRG